jgi:hypothetical protein
MKNSTGILFLIILLTTCKKDSIPPENLVSTITWEFTWLSDIPNNRFHDKYIEFYNEDNMITQKEELYYSSGDIRNDYYEYDNNKNLVEFSSDGQGLHTTYYYENGLRIKKEVFDISKKFFQYYRLFEYMNSMLHKTYHYNRDGILVSTTQNFYTSNLLDSTYHYFGNNLDSIEGKVTYHHDTSGNLIEENRWKWSVETQNFYPISKSIYEYTNGNLNRTETRTEENELFGFIYKYSYEDNGRKNRIEIYYEDQLLGYYDATYSSNNIEFIIPEL